MAIALPIVAGCLLPLLDGPLRMGAYLTAIMLVSTALLVSTLGRNMNS